MKMRAWWRQSSSKRVNRGTLTKVTFLGAMVFLTAFSGSVLGAQRDRNTGPFGLFGPPEPTGPRGQAVSAKFAPQPGEVVVAPASRPAIPDTLKSVQSSSRKLIDPAASPASLRIALANPTPLSTTLVPLQDESGSSSTTETQPSTTVEVATPADTETDDVSDASTDTALDDTADTKNSEGGETSDPTISDELDAGGDGAGPTVHGPPTNLPLDATETDDGTTPDTVTTTPETAPGPENAESLTNPDATQEQAPVIEEPEGPSAYTMEQLLPLLRSEMETGLQSRQHEGIYQRWRTYIGERLAATASRTSSFEMRGNCRLPWYEQMLKAPIAAPAEAERFSREMHEGFGRGSAGMVHSILYAREAMGLKGEIPETFVAPTDPEEALKAVETKAVAARAGLSKAIATLSAKEADDLQQNLLTAFCGSSMTGHTLDPRFAPLARRMCNLMEKMDRSGLYDSAIAFAHLTDDVLLESLSKLPETELVQVPGVSGAVVREISTSAGRIIVGGRGNNVYNLDQMNDVCAVIDLGGDDRYLEGTVKFTRPILIILDLDGNDYYEGRGPGVQGGAVFGCSLLVDRRGNDIYRASDVAQGSALCGVGILVDNDGNDYYGGVRRVQGQALGGLGILIDKNGRDQYHAALWAQGFGAPLGFGVLDDAHGDDTYYCGGWAFDGYPETPGYDGWGQGIGAGLRQIACGGIGLILEGDGDDVYEYDYMGHGGGYWAGLGIARDFAGNDTRYGGTRKMYDGSPRGERMYQRFGCGFGCHYAIGFCFDDGGNDVYGGTIMGMGMGWDLGVGYLCDVGAGNDVYNGTGSQIEGYGAQAAMGVLFDYGGDDVYVGRSQGTAPSGINPDYHQLPQCGGNFGFVVDYGGMDKYGSGVANNAVTQRGSKGGFVIDRPLKEEYDAMKEEYEKAAAAKAAAPSSAKSSPRANSSNNPSRRTNNRNNSFPW